MNERVFLAQLESANADELAQILRRPNADEERLLEVYFGAERLQRLRGLALTAQRRGLRAVSKGNLVVLHGIMGGELTVYPNAQSSQFIWMNIPRLAVGAAGWLRMTPDLHSQFNVNATGIIKKYYAEQILGLTNDNWNVKTFWFDWRQDLAGVADNLRQQIDGWFGPSADVHLVAHSMGGLVSRTYILRHPDRWGKKSRLVMLGTPNHGSFAIPQVITGAYDTVRKLALLDLTHNLRDLCTILNSFPGSMQMLPSPLQMPDMARMYDAKQWATWGVPQNILDVARASHQRLAKIVDGDRMTYIAGYNQVTKVGVSNWNRLDTSDSYTDSMAGDGTVPHALGFLYDGSTRIPTYFVECSHGALPTRSDVLAATDQILQGAKPDLPTSIPASRGLMAAKKNAVVKRTREAVEEETLRELTRRVRARSRAVGDVHETPVSSDEIRAGEILVRSFLQDDSTGTDTSTSVQPPAAPSVAAKIANAAKNPPVSIAISIFHGGIERTEGPLAKADAISVGHYVGVAPQNAELAIDKSITAALEKKKIEEISSGSGIITSLCRRGVIVGELGQNFLLPDPRDAKRVIVIAGMGRPGTFREAELVVLTRELVWSLGRVGKKNLCTVLIGAGAGNLETPDAIRAWLRGIRRALYDAQSHSESQMRNVTFVEFNEANLVRLHSALQNAVETFANDSQGALKIEYMPPTDETLRTLRRVAGNQAAKKARVDLRKSLTALTGSAPDPEAIRLTIQLQDDTFQFAALTADASVPQRDTRIDPALVDEANNQLPAAEFFAKQLDLGNLLARFLLPTDMRDLIFKQSASIVLALDATTARIHWEMLADQAAGGITGFTPEHFLGTLFGLTRQLRTTFAQLPEPPIISGRTLRVLVVADPDEDAPLPGAQEEGETVAAIFEEFGREPNRQVEVVRLFGPGQATRVAVLDQLINSRFDMMHYAGHCFFDEKNPQLSGWVFTGGKVLSANELSRIDRVPRFMFSNACESGITPDRASRRNALMAPSFAEAFFARGVANFICTAWPIDDIAALEFSRRFYRGILGLRGAGIPAEALHEAMREARREIALLGSGGMQTWGAYQHYGDPNLRLIPRGSETAPPPDRLTSPKTKRKSPRKRRTLKKSAKRNR